MAPWGRRALSRPRSRNGDPGAGRDYQRLVVGPSRPHLATDPHGPRAGVDLLNHDPRSVGQRRHPAAIRRRPEPSAPRQRIQQGKPPERGDRERQRLQHHAAAHAGDHRGQQRSRRHQSRGERERNHLHDPEHRGRGQPHYPGMHATTSDRRVAKQRRRTDRPTLLRLILPTASRAGLLSVRPRIFSIRRPAPNRQPRVYPAQELHQLSYTPLPLPPACLCRTGRDHAEYVVDPTGSRPGRASGLVRGAVNAAVHVGQPAGGKYELDGTQPSGTSLVTASTFVSVSAERADSQWQTAARRSHRSRSLVGSSVSCHRQADERRW